MKNEDLNNEVKALHSKLTIFDAHNYKINLPSQFFLNISDDFIEKINYFKKTIEDYEILFQNLYKVNYLFYVNLIRVRMTKKK